MRAPVVGRQEGLGADVGQRAGLERTHKATKAGTPEQGGDGSGHATNERDGEVEQLDVVVCTLLPTPSPSTPLLHAMPSAPSSSSSGASSSSSSTLFPAQTIQHIASTSLHLPTPLPNNVALALSQDVEHRLRLVIQDAEKFMRHSRRHALSTDDVKRALELRGMEPVYGFLGAGVGGGAGARLRKAWHAQTGGIVYNVEDDEVDVEELANMAARAGSSKLPRSNGVGWKAHWLAVEGVQPLIPENPAPQQQAMGTAPSAALQDSTDPYAGLASTSTTGAVAVAGGTTPNATSQPLVKHILSRELQVYYQRLTEALSSGVESESEEDDPAVLAALSSLRSDPGLHQLVPYLCQWISTTVASALSSPASPAASRRTITRMQRTISSLLVNPSVAIEGYVHLLLPPILSTLLFSAAEYPKRAREDAARLLSDVLARHASRYPTLRPRVARVLLEAVFKGTSGESKKEDGAEDGEDDEEQPMPHATMGTKLGAILGLAACRGGMPRALLRATSTIAGGDGDEQQRDYGSNFRRLGEWIKTQPSEGAEADVVAAVRSCLEQVAGAGEADDAGSDDTSALRTRYGDYWVEAFAQESRALRGLRSAAVTMKGQGAAKEEQGRSAEDVEMAE